MLGSEDLARYADRDLLGVRSKSLVGETKNEASWRSFENAVTTGAEADAADEPHILAEEPGYAEIDVEEQRQRGVMLIGK